MTKSIASYPPEQRAAVIARRIKNGGGGSGYWAAKAAAAKLGLPTGEPKRVSKAEFDRRQKKAGQEFAKKMAGRAKNHQLRRKPSIQNKPRIGRSR